MTTDRSQSGRSFLMTLSITCSGLVAKLLSSRACFVRSALWRVKAVTTRSFDNTLGGSDDWSKTSAKTLCRIKTRLMMYVARNFAVEGLTP
jgi:hypothetical protein